MYVFNMASALVPIVFFIFLFFYFYFTGMEKMAWLVNYIAIVVLLYCVCALNL